MKIVPQYSLQNAEYFVDAKYGAAETETVTAGRSVLSAPLVVNKSIPIVELASSELLLEENVIDSKWTIDPEHIRLEYVCIEFPGLIKLIGSNIGLNVADAKFRPSSPRNPHSLTIVKKTIPVVIGLSEIAIWSQYNERVESAPLLQYVAEKDLHLVFAMEVSGLVSLSTGTARLLVHSFRLNTILNEKGKPLDIGADEELLKLAEYIREARVVGYYLDANWLQTNEAETYQYELGDPNPIGRGVALLVRGYLLSVPSIGYAAEITEPSADKVGVTKLYMQPDRLSEPEWYVTIEEGFELPPGECNIAFHALSTDWNNDEGFRTVKVWKVLGRWENIEPGAAGLWVKAIAEFLLDGEEYHLTNTLPDSIPSHSGHRAEGMG